MSNYKNEKLDKIYRSLPKLNCKRLCQASCSTIPVGDYEKKRIAAWLGYQPFDEPEVILEKLQRHEFKLECSLLKEGLCSVHRMRPLICRLFGLVKGMSCPFGCVPERWLSDEEARKLLTKAEYFEKVKKA